MSDHPAVVAVIAETPTIDPVYGKTVIDFDGNLYDAAPIAARQAVAVLRWYAQWMVDNAPYGCGCLTNVVEIADEIEPQYLTQEGQTRS